MFRRRTVFTERFQPFDGLFQIFADRAVDFPPVRFQEIVECNLYLYCFQAFDFAAEVVDFGVDAEL